MKVKHTKLTLAALAKLATFAIDDEDAVPELREHMTANADAYAVLFVVSTAYFCAWVNGPDDRRSSFGRAVVQSVKKASAKAREAANLAKDRAASYASDLATAEATFAGDPGVVELDAGHVRAALACGEPRVRVTLASGSGADVDGRMLREILAVRPDARIFVHTLEHPGMRVVSSGAWYGLTPVRIAWGFTDSRSVRGRGGMNLRALEPIDAKREAELKKKGELTIAAGPVRVIHVPDPFAPFAVRESTAAVASEEIAQAAE